MQTRQTIVRGFTLVEMMIVLAIIAILSTLAFPSFSDYMVRTRRSEAKAMLQQAAMWMERNQAATYRYNQDPTGATINTAMLTTLGFNQTPSSGTVMYNISFASIDAAGYVLQAVPTSAQNDATCGTLAIDNTGLRGRINGTAVEVNATSESCWKR